MKRRAEVTFVQLDDSHWFARIVNDTEAVDEKLMLNATHGTKPRYSARISERSERDRTVYLVMTRGADAGGIRYREASSYAEAQRIIERWARRRFYYQPKGA